jgi:hypothetical protein
MHSPKSLAVLVLSVFGALLLYAVFIIAILGPPRSAADAGDMFGGANALFSGLAFAGVVYALVLQRLALDVQRADLRTTQEELRATKEIHQQHLEHLERSERLRLTLQLADRFSSDRMVFARSSVRTWRAACVNSKKENVRGSGEYEAFQNAELGVQSFVDFASDGSAMAIADLIDRKLAFSLFGREMINLIYEIEGAPREALQRLWPDWSPEVQPRLVRFREFLQRNVD